MKTYDDPPTKINEKLRDIALKSQALFETRRYIEAQKGFEEMYKYLLKSQPAGRRYHKGYALHNIGGAILYSGKPQKALKFFLLAYVEDLLSQNEGEEDNADRLPAGNTLSGYYLLMKGYYLHSRPWPGTQGKRKRDSRPRGINQRS